MREAVQRRCDILIIQALNSRATRQDNKINQAKAFMNAMRLKMITKMHLIKTQLG